MTINKKTIIYVIIAIALIAAISAGTVIVLGKINKGDSSNDTSTPTQASVDNLRKEAEKARQANDFDKEKELLLQAQEQNDALPKSDTTTNTDIDIKAQLHLLEYEEKN